MAVPMNSLATLCVDNIVVSVPKGSKATKASLKLCVGGGVYDVGVEVSDVVTPFGIDRVYAKSYMKLSIRNPAEVSKFCDIERRVAELVAPSVLSSSVSLSHGKCTVSTMLDRNVVIVDSDGRQVSAFAIDKNTQFASCRMKLGDVYEMYGGNNTVTYKWIVTLVQIGLKGNT